MEKQRWSSSYCSKSTSLRSVVERTISFASAIVIFSFLVSDGVLKAPLCKTVLQIANKMSYSCPKNMKN